MRRTIPLVVGLLSLGCAAETYTTSYTEPVCGWTVVTLVSMDEDAGDCEWSLRSLDTDTVRLRSIAGTPSEPAPLCEADTFARIDALRPRDVVELWAPGTEPAGNAWEAIEQSHCR
jgi:hypothetical protein